MICTMRIGGHAFDQQAVRKLELLEPYRVDVKGVGEAKFNCLYYDVASGDAGDKSAFVAAIELWLIENRKFLEALQKLENVEFRNLDIGLMLKDAAYSVSVDFEPQLIQLISDLGLSVSVSTYRTGPEPTA